MTVRGKRGTKQEAGKQLLIRLPLDVDAALEDDARRCRRSKTRQVEAILVDYYSLGSTVMQETSETRSRVSPNWRPRSSSDSEDSPVASGRGREKDSGYLMSLGTGRAPTDKERRAAGRDLSKARRIAREHQKLKKK